MHTRVALFLAALLAAATPAAAQNVADFDRFQEGFTATELVDGGITFMNLDRRIDGDPVPAPFTIEQSDGDLSGPFFSPPNTLGFSGYSPGSGVGFSRLGQFDMTTGTLATSASIEVFEFFSEKTSIINLEALKGGLVVATDSSPMLPGFQINHHTLSISGVEFDSLRLRIGPTDEDVIFAVVDNVVVGAEEICYPDCDGDNVLSIDDFVCFQTFFAFGDDYADCDGDNALSIDDFICFQTFFAIGCP